MTPHMVFRYGKGAAAAAAGGLLLLWAATVFSQPLPSRHPENTLVIAVGRDFYNGPDSRTYLHGSTHTWESLTYLGRGLKACPWLAESWHSEEDGRVWIFKLREGVRFHDGTTLTAALAKASLERIATNPRFDGPGMYRDLVRLEARGRLELAFHLSQPSPAFPNVIAYYSSPVIHPKVFDENGRLTGLTATGPYCIETIKEGDRIKLKAFGDYWGPQPAYGRVVFRTLPDAQSRAMALMAGEVDAIADVGGILPQQIGELRGHPRVTLRQVEMCTTHYLLFNCRKPPLNEPETRRWLAGTLECRKMVATLVAGGGVVASHPFSPLAEEWTFGALEALPAPAGQPPAFSSPLVILLDSGMMNRWPHGDIAQIMQAQFNAWGVRTVIAVKETGAYYEDLKQGRFHLSLQPNALMTGDPDFFYSYFVASDGAAYGRCGSGEMNDLIVQGRHAMEPERRRAIYRRLAELFADELPLLPLYHDTSYYAFGSRVASFSMDHYFRPLLLEARPSGRP